MYRTEALIHHWVMGDPTEVTHLFLPHLKFSSSRHVRMFQVRDQLRTSLEFASWAKRGLSTKAVTSRKWFEERQEE